METDFLILYSIITVIFSIIVCIMYATCSKYIRVNKEVKELDKQIEHCNQLMKYINDYIPVSLMIDIDSKLNINTEVIDELRDKPDMLYLLYKNCITAVLKTRIEEYVKKRNKLLQS